MSDLEQDEERAYFRDLIHRAYGYEVHDPEVARFHASMAKTKIASSPARTSKSYAGWKDVLPDVFYHGARAQREPDIETQRIWIVAPNYDLAKEFDYAWEDLVERREVLGFDYEIKKASKTPAQGNMLIHLHWGKNSHGQDVDTIITVKTAANEKTLQSEEIDIAILSEAARLPEIVWSKYLSTRVGRSVWPTTPDIEASWIYKEIERGKLNPGLKIESFQFTPKANPRYNYERYWIEHQKAELRSNPSAELTMPRDDKTVPSADNGHDCFDPLVECGAMKDSGFAEQFGGLWTFHRGRVVPIRTSVSPRGEPSHIVQTDQEWYKWCDVHVAFDYGYTDPAVAGFWLVGPQQVVLRRSIYERGLTPDDFAERVDRILSENEWKGRVTRYVGDPKKPEVCETFRRRGLPIWDMDKNAQADRKAGHLELMNFLATNPNTGEPFMMIHACNLEVIEEWSTLRYNDKVRDPTATSALIGRDDAYDMSRYFVQSHPPVDKVERVITLSGSTFEQTRRTILKTRKRRERTVLRYGTTGPIGSSGLVGL